MAEVSSWSRRFGSQLLLFRTEAEDARIIINNNNNNNNNIATGTSFLDKLFTNLEALILLNNSR